MSFMTLADLSGLTLCLSPRTAPQRRLNRLIKLADGHVPLQRLFELDSYVNTHPESFSGNSPFRLNDIFKCKWAPRCLGAPTDPQLMRVFSVDQAFSAFTREDRRDIFRATVFLCNTPLVTPRISSGWHSFRAAAAAA